MSLRGAARHRRWVGPAALTVAGTFCALAVALFAFAAAQELPLAALAPERVASLRLMDRKGRLLREVLSRPDGRAHWVPLDRISQHLVDATLAGEDKRFFDHHGVDWLAALRALLLDIRHAKIVSGASTLTMQLVRILQPERRGLLTKVRQAALATKLERVLDKRGILLHYLNRAPYGAGTFGAEAASRRYFGKPAAQLSLAEAALMAALPRSPSGYDPRRRSRRQRLRQRQRYILGAMFRQGRIDADALRMALAEPLALERVTRPFFSPHFVEQLLEQPSARGASELATTLDLRLQRRLEALLRETVRGLRKQGATNAALLVVDNKSGDVLAYVGSAGFNDAAHSGQVDGTRALRQPGSAIKPFLYSLAFEHGDLSPASLLKDLPAHFTTEHGDYAPRNYDGRFHGPVRARIALASSYNVPAIRVAERVGPPRLLERLRELGFADLKKEARHYGLGLALGNGEVTLQQLVAAYATLARGGLYRPLRFVQARREARDRDWRQLPPATPRRIIEARAAYLVTNVLADPLARMPAFGRDGPLERPFFAAAKTGTSKDFRDNWTVGYTRDVTVGVWVGNFDGSPMHNVSGITGAGPLWAEALTATVHEISLKDRKLPRPEGLVSARICPLSGALVGPDCSAGEDEHFLAGHEPQHACTFHRRVRIERQSGLRAGPACNEDAVEDKTFVVYPPAYRAWAASRGLELAPQRWSPRCPRPRVASLDRAASGDAKRPPVRIRFPAAGDVYFVDPDLRRRFQTIPLEASVDDSANAGVAVPEVRWLVNGKLIARAPYPYSAEWPIVRGRHRLQAELPDGRRSRPVAITVR